MAETGLPGDVSHSNIESGWSLIRILVLRRTSTTYHLRRIHPGSFLQMRCIESELNRHWGSTDAGENRGSPPWPALQPPPASFFALKWKHRREKMITVTCEEERKDPVHRACIAERHKSQYSVLSTLCSAGDLWPRFVPCTNPANAGEARWMAQVLA